MIQKYECIRLDAISGHQYLIVQDVFRILSLLFDAVRMCEVIVSIFLACFSPRRFRLGCDWPFFHPFPPGPDMA